MDQKLEMIFQVWDTLNKNQDKDGRVEATKACLREASGFTNNEILWVLELLRKQEKILFFWPKSPIGVVRATFNLKDLTWVKR